MTHVHRVLELYYNNIYTIHNNINVCDDNACDGGIYHIGVDTIPDTDHDFVNSGVVFVLQLLFYNLQRLNLYDNGHTYDIIYDICVFTNNNTQCSGHLCNNNGTNNDTPDCTSGVENGCSGTIRYRNNDISFINIYCVSVVNLAYNFVALVVTLESISSSCEQGCVCLSSELASMPPFSNNIVCLSSDCFHLSSDCGIVPLKYIPIALVASLETIYPLSTHVLKILRSSSPGLYSCSSPSDTKSLSCTPIAVSTIEPSFGPRIEPITLGFTRHIHNIMFLKFNTESFCSGSYDHIHDHGVVLVSRIQPYYSQLSIYYLPPYCLLSRICAPFSGQFLCTSD